MAKWTYAVTGPIAAHRRSPIAPVRQAMIYTDHVDIAARFLDAGETDLGDGTTPRPARAGSHAHRL